MESNLKIKFLLFIVYFHYVQSSTFIRKPACAEMFQLNFTSKHSNFIRNSPVENIHDLQEIGFDTNQISKSVLRATFMTVVSVDLNVKMHFLV